MNQIYWKSGNWERKLFTEQVRLTIYWIKERLRTREDEDCVLAWMMAGGRLDDLDLVQRLVELLEEVLAGEAVEFADLIANQR